MSELKQELNTLAPSKIKEICLRLARFKKENKELLTYLLFEAHSESEYVESVKVEINEAFQTLNKSNLHLAKKSLRKILRSITRYARYTGTPQSHIEMLIRFCSNLRDSGIPIHKSTAIESLYAYQVKKIEKLLDSLHDDLRFDYSKELSRLGNIERPGLRRS